MPRFIHQSRRLLALELVICPAQHGAGEGAVVVVAGPAGEGHRLGTGRSREPHQVGDSR